MGNTIVCDCESQGAEGAPNSKTRTRFGEFYPKGLRRKPASFLEEPVTDKWTGRGEVTLSVGATENVDANGGNKLRYAVSEMQGWRSCMEDGHLLNPKLYSSRRQEELLKGHHLFAVFDGHGGDYTSNFCRDNFVSTLVAQEDWKTYLKSSSKRSIKSRVQLLKSALTAAFLDLDAKLMEAQRRCRLSQLAHLEGIVHSVAGDVDREVFREGSSDQEKVINFSRELPESLHNIYLEHSGSAAAVVLITPSHVLCANAGDCRAILSKRSGDAARSDVLPLSFDHKPHKDVEVYRVERDGGFVRSERVDGSLAVSRGFGDFKYKRGARGDGADASPSGPDSARAYSLPKDHRVTVNPDIIVHTREPRNDEFVVLACDGVWDRLSNRKCADLVRRLSEGEADAGLICEEVLDTALELDSRDNMTCCIVFFPAAHSGALDVFSGVLRQRSAKRARLLREKRGTRNRDPVAPRREKSLEAKSPGQERARLRAQADSSSDKSSSYKASDPLIRASTSEAKNLPLLVM